MIWGRVTHICVVKLTIIGSDNGLSPGRREAIIWTNAGILLIGPLGTNFIEILIGIQTFSFKKMHLKMSSAKWRPFCLGLYVLRVSSAINWHWFRYCLSTQFLIGHFVDPPKSTYTVFTQYMHTFLLSCVVYCCVYVTSSYLIYVVYLPKSGLLHWHCGNMSEHPSTSEAMVKNKITSVHI